MIKNFEILPNSSFEIWHVINGLFVRIAQNVTEDGIVHYYVDGKEQFLNFSK